MLASEVIATIKYVEREHHGITRMYASRINWFQRQELSETQGVVYDEAFLDFVREMENEIGGKINSPTAKKILNNWYSWAKDNLGALSKMEKLGIKVLNKTSLIDIDKGEEIPIGTPVQFANLEVGSYFSKTQGVSITAKADSISFVSAK